MTPEERINIVWYARNALPIPEVWPETWVALYYYVRPDLKSK